MSNISVHKLMRYGMFIYENTIHDIKTPLTLIMTFAKILDRMNPMPEQASDYISKINIQLEKINDVLSACAEEIHLLNNAIPEQNENCDVMEVLEDVINVSRGFADLKGVSVKLQADIFYALTSTNKIYLDKILTNLMMNAIKFTDSGKMVILGLKQTKKSFIITVKDQGDGIPPEKYVEIFKRYYTSVGAKNPKGTGIGLSIVKEYTKRIGGKISVDSELGRGTVFKLIIPRIYNIDNDENNIVHEEIPSATCLR